MTDAGEPGQNIWLPARRVHSREGLTGVWHTRFGGRVLPIGRFGVHGGAVACGRRVEWAVDGAEAL